MREIKFRGKHINYENWIYGGILQWNDIVAIIQHCHKVDSIWKTDRIRVKPETVGQYIGLKDKTGKEIYSGDRIRYNYHHDEKSTDFEGIVEYHSEHIDKGYTRILWVGFLLKGNDDDGTFYYTEIPDLKDIEIIGNIYE